MNDRLFRLRGVQHTVRWWVGGIRGQAGPYGVAVGSNALAGHFRASPASALGLEPATTWAPIAAKSTARLTPIMGRLSIAAHVALTAGGPADRGGGAAVASGALALGRGLTRTRRQRTVTTPVGLFGGAQAEWSRVPPEHRGH